MEGLEILANGSIRHLSTASYEVKSRNGRPHRVIWQQQKWRCTCQKRTDTAFACEHIYAVLFSMNCNPLLRDSSIALCPDCGSSDLIKRGIRKNRYGPAQRYSCRQCKLRFDHRPGFRKMKGSPEAITVTLDLWYKGLSLNKISDHLNQFYGLQVKASTLYGWIEKYTTMMKRYTRRLKLTAAKWNADETTFAVRGKLHYVWAAMDSRTRFIIATYLSTRRRSKEADTLFRRSAKRVLDSPRKIVTDGLSSYKSPISSMDRGDGYPKHVRGLSFAKRGNNNRLERFNGTLRERTKVMRGFHNRRSAALFADGFTDYYNFIRPHQALAGKTPAQSARVLKTQKGNRWMALIGKAAHRRIKSR